MKLKTETFSQRELAVETDYILVVDDLADNRFLLKAILEAEGYKVELASSGVAALAQAEAVLPKLMLLDVMMPGMNGYEVTQRVRQSTKLASLPVVLITAHGQESAKAGKVAGANDFICKPFDFDELIKRIRAYAV